MIKYKLFAFRPALLLCFAAFLAFPVAVQAMEGHDGHTPIPPATGDPRFLPGTTGPVVVKGLAATVVIPDGPGFGGEQGRTQNSGDLRKNNYSVTDANYNNALGLLPRHPDTGMPLTYVQHIQLYAAAGYLEAFAHETYMHLLMHQNRGEGTILGAAGYLMGLVSAYDSAAHGVDPAAIPQTVPGSPVSARNYVRATKDITGQQWARMHHAQTAPAVYKALRSAGVNWSTAMTLAGDDGISGAGRLNGVNEQDGGAGGMNSGEREIWSLAAQVQQQTQLPVIHMMMGGHDHASLHESALTKPKINVLIGYLATDRSTTPERAAAIYPTLLDGRVGSVDKVGGDGTTARNEFYLRQGTNVGLHLDWPDYYQPVGTVLTITGHIENHGPHIATGNVLNLALPANMQFVSANVGGQNCMMRCALGTLGYDAKLPVEIKVRAASYGESRFYAQVTSIETDEELGNNDEERSFAFKGTSRLSLNASTRIGKAISCGTSRVKACKTPARRPFFTAGILTPANDGGKSSNRWVKLEWQLLQGKRWVKKFDPSIQVSKAGEYRTLVKPGKFRRGLWRVKAKVDESWLNSAAASSYRYVLVR